MTLGCPCNDNRGIPVPTKDAVKFAWDTYRPELMKSVGFFAKHGADLCRKGVPICVCRLFDLEGH